MLHNFMTGQLSAGVDLMLVGMGLVFLFLAMLIVAVNLMSALILRFFPITPPPPPVAAVETAQPDLIAAISIALHRYRTKHQ